MIGPTPISGTQLHVTAPVIGPTSISGTQLHVTAPVIGPTPISDTPRASGLLSRLDINKDACG